MTALAVVVAVEVVAEVAPAVAMEAVVAVVVVTITAAGALTSAQPMLVPRAGLRWTVASSATGLGTGDGFICPKANLPSATKSSLVV